MLLLYLSDGAFSKHDRIYDGNHNKMRSFKCIFNVSVLRGVDTIVPILQVKKLSTERSKNLPKITQLQSGRAKIPTQSTSRVCALNSVS